MCEDGIRNSSQSRQGEVEDLQKPPVRSSRSRSQDRVSIRSNRSRSRDHRHSRTHLRSAAVRSSVAATLIGTSRYAAGLAAQLSQRRKQLEARAKDKLKTEQENAVRSPAINSDSLKLAKHSDSPRVRDRNKGKVVIEIHDDDEQDVVKGEKEASVDLANDVHQVLVKTGDTSVKDDADVSTADGTPVSSTDGSSTSSTSTTQSDYCKSDTGKTADITQPSTSTDSTAAKSVSATVSLINLPMPPVESESDSEAEATPVSTEEL